ncbi:hypothetical protein [Vibrio marisflavi]|nr:hypothetical protein [Vibrio marisflavi]
MDFQGILKNRKYRDIVFDSAEECCISEGAFFISDTEDILHGKRKLNEKGGELIKIAPVSFIHKRDILDYFKNTYIGSSSNFPINIHNEMRKKLVQCKHYSTFLKQLVEAQDSVCTFYSNEVEFKKLVEDKICLFEEMKHSVMQACQTSEQRSKFQSCKTLQELCFVSCATQTKAYQNRTNGGEKLLECLNSRRNQYFKNKICPEARKVVIKDLRHYALFAERSTNESYAMTAQDRKNENFFISYMDTFDLNSEWHFEKTH